MPSLWIFLFFATAQSTAASPQGSVYRIFADKVGAVHIQSHGGREQVVGPEPHQVGIESGRSALDGQTVGWLVDYSDPDNSSPDAGELIIFRGGRIIRRFGTDQVFWDWSFYGQGEQVAYHLGPTHGEESPQCELHDVKSGRLLAKWAGDLDDPTRPEWVRDLNH